MQRHSTDRGAREHGALATTAERRNGECRGNAYPVVGHDVVVLNLGPVFRAVLINEANGGIAVQVRELDPQVDVGRVIDVVYRGRRHGAEIRHITANEHGFLLGLQWKKRYAE